MVRKKVFEDIRFDFVKLDLLNNEYIIWYKNQS